MADPSVLRALADRCEREPPSRDLDRRIEIETRGMLARTQFPPSHTHPQNRAATIARLRARAEGAE